MEFSYMFLSLADKLHRAGTDRENARVVKNDVNRGVRRRRCAGVLVRRHRPRYRGRAVDDTNLQLRTSTLGEVEAIQVARLAREECLKRGNGDETAIVHGCGTPPIAVVDAGGQCGNVVDECRGASRRKVARNLQRTRPFLPPRNQIATDVIEFIVRLLHLRKSVPHLL